MERKEWLKKVRGQTEALYDQLAPEYWVTYGFYANTTHLRFIEKLLERLTSHVYLLDAACGAGRYDGFLMEAGHTVLGIDQSGNMLKRARKQFPVESYPNLNYEKIGLQEMDFKEEFDGTICIDALEHIPPEDWPGVTRRFYRALKAGGRLYFTVEIIAPDELQAAYAEARERGLPVVYGELAEGLDDAVIGASGSEDEALAAGQVSPSAYHFYPSREQVRIWLDRAGLAIEEEGSGDGYMHFLCVGKAFAN